jgi:hypothetical protein
VAEILVRDDGFLGQGWEATLTSDRGASEQVRNAVVEQHVQHAERQSTLLEREKTIASVLQPPLLNGGQPEKFE